MNPDGMNQVFRLTAEIAIAEHNVPANIDSAAIAVEHVRMLNRFHDLLTTEDRIWFYARRIGIVE